MRIALILIASCLCSCGGGPIPDGYPSLGSDGAVMTWTEGGEVLEASHFLGCRANDDPFFDEITSQTGEGPHITIRFNGTSEHSNPEDDGNKILYREPQDPFVGGRSSDYTGASATTSVDGSDAEAGVFWGSFSGTLCGEVLTEAAVSTGVDDCLEVSAGTFSADISDC